MLRIHRITKKERKYVKTYTYKRDGKNNVAKERHPSLRSVTFTK
ncbi:hypothetical protein HMPREF0083_01442 [Aneurinibacillus aneurinilyticus ATCC 12856]|uniref:50S ribosomal protein L33 domain protein n=1 Tax=Aneurinibacillus aneurinilyticus ATCC 12856 TaxID=649747 RepID=U1YIB5_ANEAE|nr:hypothetical protein HMPREF0083_01442 [Aneurinibacillus aneurinilyticus ATCC 12856]